MARFNYDKINQQRRDRRKSVRVDTFKRTKAQDINSLWHSAIQRETVFLSGKYIHKDIDTIVKADPNYCVWCIDNQPQGIVARQLLRHFNKQRSKD
jgi:hypothetical protein